MLRLTIYNFWHITGHELTDLGCLTEVVNKKMKDVTLILPYFRIINDGYGSTSIRSTSVLKLTKMRVNCFA